MARLNSWEDRDAYAEAHPVKAAVKGISAGWIVILVIIVLAVVTSAGLWFLGVATSGAKGQGEAVKTKNSAENWTKAQAKFEDLYADIKASDAKVAIHAKALAADPTNTVLQTNLTGVQAGCQNLVADYNAASHSFLLEDFKSARLPVEIDGFDSDTDCK